jgi:hypothetical protein
VIRDDYGCSLNGTHNRRYLQTEPALLDPAFAKTYATMGKPAPPYSYGLDNPLSYTDPDGLAGGPGPDCSSTLECLCKNGVEAACQELNEVDPGRAQELARKFKLDGPQPPKPPNPGDLKGTTQCDAPPPDVKPRGPGFGCKASFDLCMIAAMSRSGWRRGGFAASCLLIWGLCMARGG